MAATTTLLGLVTPTQGTLSGTWGDTVNYGISDYVDIAIAGTLSFAGDGAITLANTLGSASGNGITTTTAQYMVIRVTGTLTTPKIITGPSYSKLYMVDNSATGSTVSFIRAGQTPAVSVAVGEKAFVYYNGTDYVKVSSSVADGVTTIDFGSTGLTPNTATSGAVSVAGTLAVANGGTGITSFGSGVATFLGTPSSANLAAAVTDETGSGALVFATSPSLVTPALGTPSALVGTNITGTATNFTASNVTTNANLTGAVTSVGNATSLGSFTSSQLAGALTDETGSGANVFATSPTLVTPNLGTPTTLVLSSATGLPLSSGVTGILPVANGGTATATPALVQGTGVTITGTWPNQTINATGTGGTVTSVDVSGGTTGLTTSGGPVSTSGTITLAGTLAVANGGTGITSLGAGVATFLGTPSSANLASAVTDETGTGALVFATSPTLVTPLLGTPTSGVLSACTVDGTDAVGFRNIPQNSQSAAYTLVLADAGKHIFHPVGDNNARTFTIPANSSVAYPIGTAITFINMAVANVTIAITTDTLVLSPAGTTGSRTLATNGSATCIKITSTSWLISGSGLT